MISEEYFVLSTNEDRKVSLYFIDAKTSSFEKQKRMQANAKRIVACVNACRGIPDEELENLIAYGLCRYDNSTEDRETYLKMQTWLTQALELRK